MFWEKKNFTKLRYEEFHVNIGKAHWKRITLKILSNKEFVLLTKLKGLWQVCFYRSDEKYCQPLKKYVNSSQGQGLSTARERATSKPQPTSISAFCLLLRFNLTLTRSEQCCMKDNDSMLKGQDVLCWQFWWNLRTIDNIIYGCSECCLCVYNLWMYC